MKESQYRRMGRAGSFAAAVLLLIVCLVPCMSATLAQAPQYVPNQLMVSLKPGSTEADATSIARAQGMTIVKKLPLPNAYLMTWTRSESVDTKESKVLAYSKVRATSPNHVLRVFATPNDPRYSEQWHYTMIRMPQAWDVEKGKGTVVVAVLDTGMSLNHPDIVSRLVPGWDVADGDSDVSFPPNAGAFGSGHGLHVAGTIAADTDNGIGVAGVCWEGVKIMPVKIFGDAGFASDATLGSSDAAIIDGLEWAKTNGADVVNMSIGYPLGMGYNQLVQDKITECVSAGMVIVAAAGNDGIDVVDYPAAYRGVIAVSAVNRDELLTGYSSHGPQVSVAAPGGEGPVGSPDCVLSTWWLYGVNGYETLQGTSMACPHVAGAAALLLSAGVAPSDVKSVLELSARQVGATRPNDSYGWGIIDVHAALTSGGGKADVLEPTSGQKIDSKIPRFKIRVFNLKMSSVNIYLGSNDNVDLNGIPVDAGDPIVNPTNIDDYYDAATGIISFQLVEPDPSSPTQALAYPIPPRNPLLHAALDPGAYRIVITADAKSGAGAPSVNSWSMFRVEARSQSAGMRLASVPYPLVKTATDPRIATRDFYGTTGFKMARWLPSVGAYAKLNYTGVVGDARASLFPPLGPTETGVHPHNGPNNTPPVNYTPPAGLGYWLSMDAPTPLLGTFVDDLDAYDIPVVAGWNMIGDPFPFKVDWNSLMVTYRGQSLTIAEAVTAGWMRPALYRYSPAGYSYESLPAGTFIPWEGNWVKILKGTIDEPLILSVPPVVSQVVTRNAAPTSALRLIAQKSVGIRDDWAVRLAVRAGDLRDEQNWFGTSSRSSDGYDPTDVETPPAPARFVDLSFPHRDWGNNSGAYATDTRTPVDRCKFWDFEVKTNLPRTSVRITWPDLSSAPDNCQFTMEDLAGGKRVSLRGSASYSYDSGVRPKARHFRMWVRAIDPTRVALNAAGPPTSEAGK